MTWSQRLKSSKSVLNLPNLLTLFRLLLVPVMAVFLEYDGDQPPFEKDWMFRYSPGRMASLVVAIAGITDLLDGYIARKWKIESLFGKFLDPVVDKVFLLVGLILLMKLDRVNPYLVIILLSREFLITALRAVAMGEGIVIAAGQSGKFKTIFQMAGLGFLMWYGNVFGYSAVKIGSAILWVALFLSLYSGYYYLSDFFTAKHLQKG
ncbi:MAG: CDP-diacylglycerol--glycerol-3-phosphate 3-phosphatidyltransferase [Proteobacteria bacterium]|nr:CDP-diacylglycerol--glycerol-3-phosphate 3-phosphatidyltransferase [Pseudomonadota bacterium]